MLVGCGSLPSPYATKEEAVAAEKRRPQLPNPPPNFGTPVEEPKITVGANAKILLRRTTSQLRLANARLRNDKAFQQDVWRDYSVEVK